MADRPVDPAEKGKRDKQEGLSSASKPRGRKKLLLITGAFVITMGTIGSLAIFLPGFIPIGSKGQETSPETSAGKEGYIYEMEHFIVNLADTERPRYLKVKINLEGQDRKAGEEFDQRLPQLRDAILTILSAKTYRDIYDSEGKMRLKEEILSKVNPLLSRVRVKAVYFTEFVVQ